MILQTKKSGKAAPCGVYDLTENEGSVNAGISCGTAGYAVNSIRTWRYETGKRNCADAAELLITADCGGSSGYRVRLRKTELQKPADETGMAVNVCHFPPGTGKWNKIGHRMFCHISQNRRGEPLITGETVVSLAGSTKNRNGLKIRAVPDENIYEKGKEVTDDELKSVNMEKADFHGGRNYKIKPKK